MDSDLDLSSDSVEELTSVEILRSMEKIWLNEKFAPEILPHKIDVVECLYTQIQEMEKNIEQLERNDIRRFAHEMELNRIKYLTSSYLRIRTVKIENYANTILEQEEIRRQNGHELYLSEAETVFAESFKNTMQRYFTDFFQFMPGFVPDESKQHSSAPNLNSFVFFQAERTLNGVVVNDGVQNDETVDIQNGSKMIMSYSSVESFVKNGDVKLI